jgi:hypothetical protein
VALELDAPRLWELVVGALERLGTTYRRHGLTRRIVVAAAGGL